MPKPSCRFILIAAPLMFGAAASAAAATLGGTVPKPVVRISQDGALGYDWKDWHTVVAASRDSKLKWRVGAYAVNPSLQPGAERTVPGSDAALSHLFDEVRDRSTVVITDTPWRRGGIMTMGMRLEF
jgi:hypothetical protein